MATRMRELAVGETARIVGYDPGASAYRKKLLSMGLTKGTTFTVRKRAPLGDPVELAVRGFNLSLRRAEAELLLLEREDGASSQERAEKKQAESEPVKTRGGYSGADVY